LTGSTRSSTARGQNKSCATRPAPPRPHHPDFICTARFIISGTGNFTKFTAKAGAVQGRHSTGLGD
jgi:hypothetical protein